MSLSEVGSCPCNDNFPGWLFSISIKLPALESPLATGFRNRGHRRIFNPLRALQIGGSEESRYAFGRWAVQVLGGEVMDSYLYYFRQS